MPFTFIEGKVIQTITVKDDSTGEVYHIVETTKENSLPAIKIIQFFKTDGNTGEWQRFNVMQRNAWDFEPITDILEKIISNEQSRDQKTT